MGDCKDRERFSHLKHSCYAVGMRSIHSGAIGLTEKYRTSSLSTSSETKLLRQGLAMELMAPTALAIIMKFMFLKYRLVSPAVEFQPIRDTPASKTTVTPLK